MSSYVCVINIILANEMNESNLMFCLLMIFIIVPLLVLWLYSMFAPMAISIKNNKYSILESMLEDLMYIQANADELFAE